MPAPALPDDEIHAAVLLIEAGWSVRRVARTLRRDLEAIRERVRKLHHQRMQDRKMREVVA
jgi:hypothetical protein